MTDPFQQFAVWFAQAQAAELNDPGACALATVEEGADGIPQPDVRIVLMRSFDARGFVFHTNYLSEKGQQIGGIPRAAMAFHWKSLRKQVRLGGPVERISAAESDAYFARRPRANQISAWASLQSQPLPARADYEARLGEMEARFPGEVPRPENWGGFRLVPHWIEYWEDREGRQHHRMRWDFTGNDWVSGLLYP
ncbi:pyridoxamine 5'-phosphate oxidase [Sandaracinobacteroides hominis]|uniref:pyridoxamine 5'-phosphate oxidase n=1 Tax=Sandaracinobacteroides hominis TaxID=2780086 RepID=UPI0018F5E706|nr:pyridoxamine 5'-phosphate oxidase [Sandaracinobacteroides hominis]